VSWAGRPAEPMRAWTKPVSVGPTVPARATRARSGGRPCKHGPRGADGYCPKAPRGGGRPCKYGPRGADGYCPKRPSSGRRSSSSSSSSSSAPGPAAPRPETAAQRNARLKEVQDIAQGLGQVAIYTNWRKVGGALRTPVRAMATRSVIGTAVAVGVAAFAGATAALRGIRNRRERREREQFLAGRAYRLARLNLEERLGRPLRAEERDLLAAEWRDRLPRGR